MSEKSVVGISLASRDANPTIYIQGNYSPDFARFFAENLAYSYKVAKGDLGLAVARFVEESLSTGSRTRMAMDPLPSDHTIHMWDIYAGRVRLYDKDSYEEKVSFTVPDFLARYDLSL